MVVPHPACFSRGGNRAGPSSAAARDTFFGFKAEGWKPWTMLDGTPVLAPKGFNTDPEPNGDVLMYPEGDRSAPPSGRMPRGGYYFDAITSAVSRRLLRSV